MITDIRVEQLDDNAAAIREYLESEHNLTAVNWTSWEADGDVTLTLTGTDLTDAGVRSELRAPRNHPVWDVGLVDLVAA